MKLKSAIHFSLLFVTTLSSLQAQNVLAVPAFARRESAKCQMCHYRLPELNEDGHSYIRRGLREERRVRQARTRDSNDHDTLPPGSRGRQRRWCPAAVLLSNSRLGNRGQRGSDIGKALA